MASQARWSAKPHGGQGESQSQESEWGVWESGGQGRWLHTHHNCHKSSAVHLQCGLASLSLKLKSDLVDPTTVLLCLQSYTRSLQHETQIPQDPRPHIPLHPSHPQDGHSQSPNCKWTFRSSCLCPHTAPCLSKGSHPILDSILTFSLWSSSAFCLSGSHLLALHLDFLHILFT